MKWRRVDEWTWTIWRVDHGALHAEVSERSAGGARWTVWLDDDDYLAGDDAPSVAAAQSSAELWMLRRGTDYEWCSGADEA